MKDLNSLYFVVFCLIFANACKQPQTMKESKSITPPLADRVHYQLKKHDDIRIDPYYWLRERDNPEVIDYLERENDYYQKVTAHTDDLKTELFEELKSRIKEDDESVPYFYNGYWYITRFETGKDYPIYVRKKESLEAEEELLFDCNELAKGHSFFRLTAITISPDNTKAAFAVDTVSRRLYTLYVKDLETGKQLGTEIPNTSGSTAWAADNQHLFYTAKDPVTLRSAAIYRHDITQSPTNSTLIFDEKDETFSVSVSNSKSDEYIFINSFSTLTTEEQFLRSDDPLGAFKVVQKRTRGLEYSVAHMGDHFYILTNKDGASNNQLMKTEIATPEAEHWQPLLAHREEVLLEDVELFKDYWAVTERENGLTRIRIKTWEGDTDFYIPLEGETYSLFISTNLQFDTSKIRYGYSSLKTPYSVFEFDMATQETILLKEQEVTGMAYNKDNYIEKRVWATARDGVKVPMSMVYHKDTQLTPQTPILQYAYGSYGSTVDPGFSSSRISLLDRGFVYVIAHIRGGQYLGRHWYEDGKLFKKKNTFTDFIDCSKHLIDAQFTSAEHLYAYGGSAGGLLMGAVINEAPELYNGVIAAVPFVDVITTMLDEDIPLTTSEYDEWGNPNDKAYYDYMLSYSPYDQVREMEYPNLLVTTGLHDSQVQYWEPAKWVAKLRVTKTGSNILLLDTNMDAGHGGASGRFESLKELAKKYAFFLDLEFGG